MKKIKKIYRYICKKMIRPIAYFNNSMYMKLYINHLTKNGMIFHGTPMYIAPTVYFDGTDYSLIEIGNGTSISMEVVFLTHDFSMNTVYPGLDLKNKEELDKQFNKNKLLSLKKIAVGNNTFIGARAFVLAGSTIGNNCLIGAGAVVRGHIPDNSIVIGNPCKVVKQTSEWLENKKFHE